jgi:hypothetical protein
MKINFWHPPSPQGLLFNTHSYSMTFPLSRLFRYTKLEKNYNRFPPTPIDLNSNQKIDRDATNIFILDPQPGTFIDSMDRLLQVKDYVKWAIDRNMIVLIDGSWESPTYILNTFYEKYKEKTIQWFLDELGLNKKNFRIISGFDNHCKFTDGLFIDFHHFEGKELFEYCRNYQEFFAHHTVARRGYGNIENPHLSKKYFYSTFIGDIAKPHRHMMLAGLMAEGLIEDSFWSGFNRPHNNKQKYWSPKQFNNQFKYWRYLDKYWHSKICIQKLFEEDVEEIKRIETSLNESNLLPGAVDNRIPNQLFESYFNIVCESHDVSQPILYTEKTWRPIASGVPFIINGSAQQNYNLKYQGYEIFPEIFDYSFEDVALVYKTGKDYILNRDKQFMWVIKYIEMFIDEIKRVSKEPRSIFNQPSVVEKVKHNQERFRDITSPSAITSKIKEFLL